MTESCGFIERLCLSSVGRPALLSSISTNIKERISEVETVVAPEVRTLDNIILVHRDWAVSVFNFFDRVYYAKALYVSL